MVTFGFCCIFFTLFSFLVYKLLHDNRRSMNKSPKLQLMRYGIKWSLEISETV